VVLGHRGLRMNTSSDEGVRENTLNSLLSGRRAGATWVEFDVQVTSDGVPVLWHDDTLLTLASEGNVQQNEIGEITLEDFRTLGSGVQVTRHETNQLLARKFSGSNELIPWTCVSKTEESFQRNGGQPTTLQEALMDAPSDLCFDIELKFQSARPSTESERAALLGKTLHIVREFAGSRLIFFSSFDPCACIEMRQMQNEYPVLMLTCMQEDGDPRRGSLEAALEVAIQHDLDGVVADNAHLFKEMEQISRLKTAGKCLLTYGRGNTDPETILKQVAAGVNGLCTDDISVCNNMITAAKLLESALPALYDTMLPVAAKVAALATLPAALPTTAVSVV